MKWIIVDEDYLTYLRNQGDQRIPLSNYGEDKYKPFFGSLFDENGCCYVTQISHPQTKHNKMKNSLDFKKIYIPNSDRLLAVVNLNYMFPIPQDLYRELRYKDINQYKHFKNTKEQSKYIDLLRRELEIINSMDVQHSSLLVYQNKYDNPDSPLAQRSLDYKELEKLAIQYKR